MKIASPINLGWGFFVGCEDTLEDTMNLIYFFTALQATFLVCFCIDWLIWGAD